MRRSSTLKGKNSVFLFQFVSDSNPLVILVICAADRRTSSAYEHGEQGDIQIGAWGDFPSRVFDANLNAGADLDELDEGEEMMGSKYDDVDEDRRPVKFRDFYFRALGSLVVLSFPQPINFSSLLPKLLSETLTGARTEGCRRRVMALTVTC